MGALCANGVYKIPQLIRQKFLDKAIAAIEYKCNGEDGLACAVCFYTIVSLSSVCELAGTDWEFGALFLSMSILVREI